LNPRLRLTTSFIFFIALSGCGSMMATFESDTIEEDPGERSFSQQVEDESIETKAIVNIHAASEDFDSADFLVVSYNGYVLIAGEVASQALKDQASSVVREIPGVRRIYNEMEIGRPSDAKTEASDVWITAQVKSVLLFGSDTPSMRVKVVTENSVVYLMGLLTPEEAQRVAEEAAEVKGVTRVVQLFEII
jgi:osmotically-inducible protein OsmY